MTVEEIAIRKEVRQLLREAGYEKNQITEMVKDVLKEEIGRACDRAIAQYDTDNVIQNSIKNVLERKVTQEIREAIDRRVSSIFRRMTISVDITDEHGISSISHPA